MFHEETYKPLEIPVFLSVHSPFYDGHTLVSYDVYVSMNSETPNITVCFCNYPLFYSSNTL